MKSRTTLILTAMLSTLVFTACKKAPEPAGPPEPQSQAPAENSSAPGKTTTFENPPPPEPAQPAEQQ